MSWWNPFKNKKPQPKDISKKFLIVGLGNIGIDYALTRHNLGFDVLNYIAKKKELKFTDLRYGAITKFNFKGRVFIFLKPSTYVNKSGDAVKYWMVKEKINLQNLLVICDDLNIPFGSIRIKTKGSDGGHNGLKDLQAKLGTNNYGRLRFGIKNETKKNTTQFVLDKWNQNEQDILETYFIKTEKAIFSYTLLGPSNAMNNFNN
ncbi:MAG: aminoacyl-tRNA hydrolase [Flavobacteriaceae bacterium]|tara:strand:+ start:1694 stop:2305 length:612 start_codon:yes stop_codon:yes gene_type:complete